MLKKLIKNSAIYGAAPYIPRIIAVLLLPIMTKYLTDVDFGIAGTISAYTLAIGAFSNLGFGVVLLNSFYHSPCQYKILWRQIYGFLQFWMIIFAIIQGFIIYMVLPKEAEEYRWAIIILTNFSTVFFGPTAMLGNSYFVYKQQPIPIVWRSILSGIITILVNYVMIVYYRMGYMGWYIGSFAGMFFSNASYWYVVNKRLGLTPIYAFRWKTIIRSLKVALPTIPHMYTDYLMNGSGRMIMDRYNISIGKIGELSMIQQVGGVFASGVGAINTAVAPMIMENIRNNNENRSKIIIYWYIFIVYLILFLTSVWSKEIFSVLISNAQLSSTYHYFIVFVMALCYRPMYVGGGTIFFYYEKTIQLLKITFTSGLIAFLLYIIFIPHFEIWAFVIGYYISCLFLGYAPFISKTFREKSKVNYPYMRIMGTQILLMVIALLLVDCNIFIKLLATLFFICVCSFVCVKLVKRGKVLYGKE